MSELEDCVKDMMEARDFSMNSWIAVTVAITATAMAIGNIKDGNIAQAMAQVQSKSVDSWSYYQAKSTKEIIAANSAEQLREQIMMNPGMSREIRAGIQAKVSQYEADGVRYEKEKEEVRQVAENYEKEYERLNVRDDQFDMAEAFFTVSIALCGITALTRRRWLFGVAVVFACCGLLSELAGFMQWSFHPEWLTRLLG